MYSFHVDVIAFYTVKSIRLSVCSPGTIPKLFVVQPCSRFRMQVPNLDALSLFLRLGSVPFTGERGVEGGGTLRWREVAESVGLCLVDKENRCCVRVRSDSSGNGREP